MYIDLYSKIIDRQNAINKLLNGGKVETKPQVIDDGEVAGYILYKFCLEYDGTTLLLYSSSDIIQYQSYVKAFKKGVEITRKLDAIKELKGEKYAP